MSDRLFWLDYARTLRFLPVHSPTWMLVRAIQRVGDSTVTLELQRLEAEDDRPVRVVLLLHTVFTNTLDTRFTLRERPHRRWKFFFSRRVNETGFPQLDRRFDLETNDVPTWSFLLWNAAEQLAHARPRLELYLQGTDQPRVGRPLPLGLDRLVLRAENELGDPDDASNTRVTEAFDPVVDAFLHIVRRLPEAFRTTKDEVELAIRQLIDTPGGRITEHVVVWDSNRIRADAARRLAELGDPRAVPVLAEIADGPANPVTRAALEALATFEGLDVSARLLRLLGRTDLSAARRRRVVTLLQERGHARVGEALSRALQGYADVAWEALRESQFRPTVVATADRVVAAGVWPEAGHAARILGELGVVESLPALRRLAAAGAAATEPSIELVRAIEALETLASLPRGSTSGPAETALPRAVSTHDAERDRLPQPAADDDAASESS